MPKRLALFRTGTAETGRVEAFSDGVLAIVITLLVLEIHVPQVAGEDGARWRALRPHLQGRDPHLPWRRLDDIYRPLLRRWLHRDPRLAEEAEDVVQEVMLVLVRELPRLLAKSRVLNKLRQEAE